MKRRRTYFQKLTAGDDSIAQYAYYHLAACYLGAGDKRSARTAFQSAGKMDYSKSVKEEAQFAYAKLSYELNYQSVAIESFRSFMKNYPESAHTDEAMN
jgi:TolA-binding protein